MYKVWDSVDHVLINDLVGTHYGPNAFIARIGPAVVCQARR